MRKQPNQPITVAKVPCGSCPYRRDVPSGVWSKHEYDKLLIYDGSIPMQFAMGGIARFDCHQRDGNLCAGWLACHRPENLLAIRFIAHKVDPVVLDYKTDVPVFESGAAARRHGIARIKNPGKRAVKMVAGLVRKGL